MRGERIETTSGVPRLVETSFPYETWEVAGRTLTVDMGTRLHVALINAAKASTTVSVVVSLEFPPLVRGTDDDNPYFR